MSTVLMVTLDAINGKPAGAEIEVSEREAKQLEDRHLAKRATEIRDNKMRAEPSNKAHPADPSVAAGGGSRSSASPAARVSAKKTAAKSASGSTATRRRAASSR